MRRTTKFLMVITILGMTLAACSPADPSMLDATLIAPQPLQLLNSTNPALPGKLATPTASPTPANATEESTPQATSTPVSTPEPSLGVDPNQLTGLTVQFWHPWSGETAQVVQELVDEFNLTNELGIQVDMQAPGSLETLSNAVRTALPTGKTPDLIAAYLFEAQSLSAYQPLVDLSPYLEDADFGLSDDELADLIPAFWDAAQVGGKRLGIPALGSGQVLFYNQTWAEELGFSSPPATPQELEQQACRAAQANKEDDNPDNDGTGGLALSTRYSAVLGWLAGFGGEVYDPVKTKGSQNPYDFGSKSVEEAFTFLRSLYDLGCAWLPDEPYPEDAFASRRALLAVNSLANLPYQAQVMQRDGSGDRWTVIPFPAADGQPAIDVYGPAFEVFSSTPERQLAAWVFVHWLLSPENQARLAQASDGFPVRQSAAQALQSAPDTLPQLAAAQDLLQYAHAEPAASSWQTIRWTVSDAATQLFRSYFTIDQVPELVKFLDKTAGELHANPP